MAKRLAIVAYDVFTAMLVSLVASCALALPAYAYIDPSVMTYTIQAVAGVAVALSAVAGVALRRGRKVLLRMLDIDENAKREFEPEVHRTDTPPSPPEAELEAAQPSVQPVRKVLQPALEKLAQQAGENPAIPAESLADQPSEAEASCLPESDGQPDAAQQSPASDAAADQHGEHAKRPEKKRRRRARPPYKPPWKERLAYGLAIAVFFTFTIFFVAPLEIVAGSASSLIYSMSDVWWVLIAPGLGMIAFITLALSLFRGRGFSFMLALVAAVALCAYVQALFLNVGLPAADGATIVWADYMTMQIVSSVVWIAIVVAACVFSFVKSKRSQGVALLVSGFLVLVQAVGLASLAISPPGADAEEGSKVPNNGKIVMTEDQLFTVNPEHNVIVFILDTYDTAYLTSIMRTNPNILDGLTGFTNYENATSAMIPTRFAIPEMLTGQMPSFDEKFSTYKAERYARGTFLDSIYDANYSLGLYTDSLVISRLSAAEQYAVTSKTVNMHDLPNSMMDVGGTLYSLYQIGLYRDVLWPFKWAFWYYTDQINQSMTLYQEEAPPEETIYVMDDIRYYNRLCDIGLSFEQGDYAGAFRFIHLLGSHYPFNYDEEVNDLGEDNSSVLKQSQGAIHIVNTYIDELKRLGVYENTTIIITADHGYWTITLDPIEETSTPIMFVKPEQSAEADARPIVTDEKPVSHLDLQATVLDAMGLDYSEYADKGEWSGYSMLRHIDPNRKRHYLTTDSEPDLTEVQFREYLIDGNALDWNNWSETGRTIDAQE